MNKFIRALIPGFALLLSACLLSRDVVAIDLGTGTVGQRELVVDRFAGRDKLNPPADWPPPRGEAADAVSAAWWGFDPEDSTAALQAALSSGARTVLVPRMGSPWTCRRLFIKSHTTLILEEGAVLEAKAGEFQGTNDTLLNILEADDVTVTGYGAVLRMRRSDYWRAPYAKGEWRHTIQIRGGNRVTIQGLTAELSGGDGVYLGRGGSARLTNTDIVLKDLILRDHYRQGISVITARGLRIENVEMSRTQGTPPGAGIDFEPNLPDEPVSGCLLKRCQIRENAGAGFQCYLINLNGESEPFDITLEDCQVYGNLAGALVFGLEKGARGRIVMRNTRIFGLKILNTVPGRAEVTEK